jgi:hypothetical protein
MKKFALIGLITITFATVLAAIPQTNASASSVPSSWQKSAAYNPSSSTDFSSLAYQQAARQLASDGANYITLIIPYHQSTTTSTDIQAGNETPTDAAIADGISYAHSIGLKVMLKPHIDPYDGQWRAYINPTDRTTWFNKYGAVLTHLGQIGQANGAEEYCLGTELYHMASETANPTNGGYWQTMIKNVKAVYSGKLTYSAQYYGDLSEKNQISFWPQLDYLGISGYYELGSASFASVSDLTAAWTNWNNSDIKPFQQKYNKPLIFTEVGYRSVTAAHTQPWNYSLSGVSDQAEQARDYDALLGYWSTQPNFAGVSLWDWNSTGDTSYSPRGKQAETIMKQYFTSVGSTPAPTTGYVANVSATSLQSGTSSTVTLKLTPAASTSDSVVDLEIYNSSGQKVFQVPFEHQALTSGVPTTLTANWTPASAGVFTTKVGVFTAGWTSNLYWNDAAASLSVTSSTMPSPTPTPAPIPSQTPAPTPTPAPSPQTSSLSIWWPGVGVTVSGVQPFKAVVNNLALSAYHLYWQVDGGALNELGNVTDGTLHKESPVDVSTWHWNANNQYRITFTAKDNSGQLIAMKDVVITVAH